MEVDIIIPTYKPGRKFLEILDRLERQTVPIQRIILMNTEEKYYEELLYGSDFKSRYSNIEVHHISKREFDHGNTRNKGVKKSHTPYFVCMTQDAMPEDEFLLERLLSPLREEDVAVSYARQLPAPDCGLIERYTREFNYPQEPCIKGKEDIPVMGIKAFFCSNVCAAYKRDVYDALGGFIKRTIFNEDMIFAAGALKAGWKIAYAADAKVVHSHNYTGIEYFHRNFDLGVSQADHPEIFKNLRSEAEGIKLVRRTGQYLKQQGAKNQRGRLYWISACKYLGYRLGKNYTKLPKWIVKKCSMDKKYWNV